MIIINNQNPLPISLTLKSDTNQRLAFASLFKWEKGQPNKAKRGVGKTKKNIKTQKRGKVCFPVLLQNHRH